jgi:hypothetical protein
VQRRTRHVIAHSGSATAHGGKGQFDRVGSADICGVSG